MNLLVLTIEKYQDIELNGVLGPLNAAGKFSKIVYWNPDGISDVYGSNHIGSIKTITSDININDYDAIFVPGGKACIELRTNEKAIDLIKNFIENDKWIFAICDAPNAIVEKGLLLDKKYSSYPINNIEALATNLRQKDYVTVDGKYITGKCPSASIDLALKILEVVFDKQTSDAMYKNVYGIEA